MIPVQPIDDFMEHNQLELFDLFHPISATIPADQYGTTRQQTILPSVERPNLQRWKRRLAKARKRGQIDAFLADEFCCDVLRTHPYEVYGESWFKDAA